MKQPVVGLVPNLNPVMSRNAIMTMKADTHKIAQALGNAAYTLDYAINSPVGTTKIMNSIDRSIRRRFYPFIDIKAASAPSASWHLYEPGGFGVPTQRLFALKGKIAGDMIVFSIAPLMSRKSSPRTSAQLVPSKAGRVVRVSPPFKNRFLVGEFNIPVTISPRKAKFLAFEADGKLVFTKKTIVANPGKHSRGFLTAATNEFFETTGRSVANRVSRVYGGQSARLAERAAGAARTASTSSDARAKSIGSLYGSATSVVTG